jgi:hypothetical protein
MTALTETAAVTKTAQVAGTAATEALLRDVAYVLKLTRRVKEEMTTERAPAKHQQVRTAEGALVA